MKKLLILMLIIIMQTTNYSIAQTATAQDLTIQQQRDQLTTQINQLTTKIDQLQPKIDELHFILLANPRDFQIQVGLSTSIAQREKLKLERNALQEQLATLY